MLKWYIFVAKGLHSNCFRDGSHDLSTWNEFEKIHCLKAALDSSSLFWNKWYFLYDYSSYLVCSVSKTGRRWGKEKLLLRSEVWQNCANPKIL